MLNQESEVKSLLDPRTKLLLVITIATVMIGGSNLGIFGWGKHLLAVIPLLLFLLEKQWRSGFLYGGSYLLATLGEQFLLGCTYGFLNFILVAFFMVITKFMPGFAMASYLMKTTTVSAFMASMEKLHMPQAITISLAVTFRFFPTIGEEHNAIKQAMQIRGVRLGGRKTLQMFEYRLIPLMISCMSISEDLSAAALTRGLGGPRKRTNIVVLRFHFLDILALGFCAAAWVMFVWGLMGR